MGDKIYLTEIRERLSKFIEHTGLTTNAFAGRIGLNQPTLYNQLTCARQVSLDTVFRVCFNFPELSREWLLMGEGEMLKTDTPTTSERVMRLLETITLLQETINKRDDTIAMMQARIVKLESYLNK